MQPSDSTELPVQFGREMPRDQYDDALRTILSLSDRPRTPDTLTEQQLLIGIWHLLLDIRDRLPSPSSS